jgi:uncharacterized repeat protein (TIGR01451 family)
LTLLAAASAAAGYAARPTTTVDVVPGEIRADATFEHIGVLWWITGDDDLDSTFGLEYRRVGESTWHPGAPAMRAYPTLIVDGAPLGLDYWAASAMFLLPGQTYELRATLDDPDGGGETRIITATTRTMPQANPAGQYRYVVPGSGGGSGTPADPFQGLQAAADAAQPGDILLVAAGSYSPFQLLTSGTPGHPIVFRGPGDGTAIVDGAGTDRGVVTLGEYDQTLAYIIIEGLTIQNGAWGVDAQHTHDIVLQYNIIRDVADGVVNRRGDALEGNQTICDNVIEGRVPWPGSGIPSEEGIDLRGYGNVVCHNTVRYFGDCISVMPSTGPSYGNDVYGNDVSYCVDDGIEIDYNQANARAWRNRVMNSRMGVSVQPIRGGPAYILRNELYNLESVPIKMHNDTAGFYVVHNTGAKHVNGHGDNGAMWRYATFRNNLFLGTRYAFEFTTVADEGWRDFDYDAWGTTREIDPGGPYFKWDNVRYDRLSDLQSVGVELHGVEASFADLVDAALPTWWDQPAEPGSRDLRLVAGAPEIDAGVDLPNLNDAFSLSGPPDMGAFEYGRPRPPYGPRPRVPDLSPSAKRASQPIAQTGQKVTYTVAIQNQGAPFTQTVWLTDTVPAGLSYVPGTLTATLGQPDDSLAPLLRWSDTLGDITVVTITYAVTVSTSLPEVISNTVTISATPIGTLTRTSTITANGWSVYLPLVARGDNNPSFAKSPYRFFVFSLTSGLADSLSR